MTGRFFKKFKILLLSLVIIAGLCLYMGYRFFYGSNTQIEEKSKLIYIRTGSDFEQVTQMLEYKGILKNIKTFITIAKLKNYNQNIIPGRYRVMKGMSNLELINLLESGKQEPVKLNLYNIRTKYEFAGLLSRKIEEDSITILKHFKDEKYVKQFGFDTNNFLAMFIPGPYIFWWTDVSDKFINHMHDVYENFWTEEKRKVAEEKRLTPLQVSILASIVQAEQGQYNDEKRVIAGLYINRLHADMPLQSDPTLIFARGDFSIQRVREGDKKVNSSYNTYIHTGLPPGPINMPDTSSLNAVLFYQKNDYLYMCAEADFSGRHHFSKTLKEQNEYAEKYHQALDAKQLVR